MLNAPLQISDAADQQSDWLDAGPESVGTNPFPGLRPFTLDECHLYFGREGQVDELLFKISKNRSVTVLGYSGSGKSSLMLCGLVPVLYGGFMTETGPNWQVITTRPGVRPLDNLTQAVVSHLSQYEHLTPEDEQIQRAVVGSVLRSSSEGLLEVARYIQRRTNENVFFMVDQFEEIFRYKYSDGDRSVNEAHAYVNLFLTALRQKEVPVYASFSMRSDFIGESSSFPGLAEMINASNYLIPQMTREQRRMAIEGPVAVSGGRIAPRLVKRLLSDMGDHQDQLPILQHALMRTWDYWVANHEPGEPMDIRHYNAIGKVGQALSLHANEAFEELSSREKEIAEILFKSITERNRENKGIRRAIKVSTVAELAEASENDVIKVIDHFRRPGRSFIMPGAHVAITGNSTIELSHESLMRIWVRLTGWVGEEFESAQMYLRISEAAAMYQIGRTGLWRPPDLQLALNWQKKQKPTRTWAQRYDPAFERAIVFLDTSRITYEAELRNQEMLQRRMLRRARVTNIILSFAFLIAMLFLFYGFVQNINAKREAENARLAEKEAIKSAQEADNQRKIAERKTKEVEQQNATIRQQQEELKKTLVQLSAALKEAEVQKNLALSNEKLANVQRDSARAATLEARRQFDRAEKEFEKANRLLYLSVAQSLEAKSVTMDDPELSGLLSMQGYLFHAKYDGKQYDPYVFRGLYYALTKLKHDNYNAVFVPENLRNKMYGLAVSQTSSRFYTTGNDGRIFGGDYTQLKVDAPMASNRFPNRVLAVSSDDRYLVNGSDSSYVQIYSMTNPGTPVLALGHRAAVTDLHFLPGSHQFLSVSSDLTVRLTDAESGKGKQILKLPYDLKSIDVTRDGKWMAGASSTGKLILVSLVDYTVRILKDDAPQRFLSVAFHPTRPLVAVGTELLNDKGLPYRGTVRIYNYETDKLYKELPGHRAGVSDIEFSPDGLLLASAGLDRKMQMWVVDHEDDLPVEMDNNNGYVWRLGFSKDANYLVASCNNGEIRVYPTNPDMLAEQVCPELKRNMSPEEWQIYVGNGITYEATCKSLLIKDF
ncbi:MAG: hypothetical protein K1X47_10435 [Cyclobacteriaceae bacterium]|nr:hypothetical protein [Cyclobacteriaceae bacterium]